MGFPSVFPKATNLLASSGVKPSYITGLDSATVALRSLAKYLHTGLKKLDGRYLIPKPMQLDQLDAFLAQNGDRYSVRCTYNMC